MAPMSYHWVGGTGVDVLSQFSWLRDDPGPALLSLCCQSRLEHLLVSRPQPWPCLTKLHSQTSTATPANTANKINCQSRQVITNQQHFHQGLHGGLSIYFVSGAEPLTSWPSLSDHSPWLNFTWDQEPEDNPSWEILQIKMIIDRDHQQRN